MTYDEQIEDWKYRFPLEDEAEAARLRREASQSAQRQAAREAARQLARSELAR